METIVPVVLVVGLLATVVLFRILEGRDALLVALVGGWAFLPVGAYPASVFGSPLGHSGSAHALVIPTAMLANKATALGLGCLLGALLFDWDSLRRVRWSWSVDLPALLWCAAPMASAAANGHPLSDGLAQARYLGLTWGVPYLLGRAYLGESDALRRFARALVWAGLACAPFCLAEIVVGPFLYGEVYGTHPYQFAGSARPLGHRPVVFQEHGNQLGRWMATAAIAAVWLWRMDRKNSQSAIPAWLAPLVLVVVCLAGQSHGSLFLGGVLVPAGLWVVAQWVGWRRAGGALPRSVGLVATSALGALLVGGLLMAGWVATDAGLRGSVRSVFASIGKTSIPWRFGRLEENLEPLTQHPLFGSGRADWSDQPGGRFLNPVNLSLALLACGSYGVVGLASLTALLVLPVVRAWQGLPSRAWATSSGSIVALSLVLVVFNLVDGALANSAWLVPMTAAIGGLATWGQRHPNPAGSVATGSARPG